MDFGGRFLVVPGGERVSHFFLKYLKNKNRVKVGSVGMNSQNL